METKYITIPFDLERAKRITNKEEDGRIVTRNGESVRILSFDRKDEFRPVIALVNNGEMEIVYALGIDGRGSAGDTIGNRDLLLSVPEWATYKDGDILYAESIFGSDFIFVKKDGEHRTLKYVSLMNKIDLSFESRHCCEDSNIKNIRKATKEEKQTIINALRLSKNELAKEYLKRFFNYKEEYKFKPFDKVLVRNYTATAWSANIYSHSFKTDGGVIFHSCGGLCYKYCIPYNEQTKHLVGTTDNWEE